VKNRWSATRNIMSILETCIIRFRRLRKKNLIMKMMKIKRKPRCRKENLKLSSENRKTPLLLSSSMLLRIPRRCSIINEEYNK
jgi:hypothetical protein